MKSVVRPLLRFTLATLSLVTVAACGSTEAPALTDHTVRIKFFNAEQQDLDPVESEHFGGITFNPTALATVARVTGNNFQFDVTGGTAGTGTLQVGYGHDDLADEVTFDPATVTVTGP